MQIPFEGGIPSGQMHLRPLHSEPPLHNSPLLQLSPGNATTSAHPVMTACVGELRVKREISDWQTLRTCTVPEGQRQYPFLQYDPPVQWLCSLVQGRPGAMAIKANGYSFN
ncbi:hypothetical protein D918_06348 [Trichuris suis]|nr:hypothetical protein D918_06348 [Trichuris suis]